MTVLIDLLVYIFPDLADSLENRETDSPVYLVGLVVVLFLGAVWVLLALP